MQVVGHCGKKAKLKKWLVNGGGLQTMSDYKTGNSASVFNDDGNKGGKCRDCGQYLSDNETYEAYGWIYCGTCYQGK